MATFPVIPDPTKVLLIDTSKWQNDPTTPKGIDFEIMKASGCQGVIMKVGQGGFIDRDWKANLENAKKAGLPVGGYWYYDNKFTPKSQAKKFLEETQETLELGLWLDLEDRSQGQYRGWKRWYDFLEEVKSARPNAKIGIYTGYYYWTEYTQGSGIPPASLKYFEQYPLWIASYNPAPKIPKPWENHTIWQFTDLLDGKFYGVESKELDGNYFNGTKEDYEKLFGISSAPVENPQPSQKFIVGLQEYALSLGGTVERLEDISLASASKREEIIMILNYILNLDRGEE